MGFDRAQLERYRDATVPDLIGSDLRLLFVGINPGLWTAATQTHFCHPSNRFYLALRRSGLISFNVDSSIGMTDRQRSQFVSAGMGISNLVARATVRASELDDEELRAGAVRLGRLVHERQPTVVAVAGITAYRVAFSDREAVAGVQRDSPLAAETWVIPNPSGLNAHETVDSLAHWVGTVADRAGLS